MTKCRDLTIDDCKVILDMKGNALDVLAAVGERGKEIFEDHVAAMEAKRETRIYHHDDGEASTSTAPKGRKCNLPNIIVNGQQPPSPLPEEFEKLIEEMARGKTLTPATLVIQKCLFDTDLSPNNNRLSIPMSQVIRDDFLTDDEKRHLCTYDTYMKKKKNKYIEVKKKRYIEVKIIEPSLELETVKFCRWDMTKSSSYVINGKWSPIVMRNNLRKEMEVQLWSFRVDQDLCFALVTLPQNPSPD